jgi:hypothetical protein
MVALLTVVRVRKPSIGTTSGWALRISDGRYVNVPRLNCQR